MVSKALSQAELCLDEKLESSGTLQTCLDGVRTGKYVK